MTGKPWRIAIFGTFDVENYGDLLFPIVAEAELSRRLGQVELYRFSYHTRTPPEWPYAVTSLTELPAIADSLDGVLVGGGFIVRFDKFVATGYGPPTPSIHHPTGYWLTPALIALQHGVPVIWNAPGMHCNDIPGWAEPLLELALANSRLIRVRDEPSRAALARFDAEGRIGVLPDTAFGIPRLVDDRQPSAELTGLRERFGLSGRYIVVQATTYRLDLFRRMLREHAAPFADIRFLILPIGPVLGDGEEDLAHGIACAVRLDFWPQPLLLAELIAHADAVVGHSYHLAITALAFGVPVFSSADLSTGKYTAFSGVDAIHALPAERDLTPEWFISRMGKRDRSAFVNHALEQLEAYWDQVAATVRQCSVPTSPTVNCFWQSLPTLLENMAVRLDTQEAAHLADRQRIHSIMSEQRASHEQRISDAVEAERAACVRRVDELERQLAMVHADYSAVINSRSVRWTAPLRAMSRTLKHFSARVFCSFARWK